MELPNIAVYAYQDVHVWSALLTCMRPLPQPEWTIMRPHPSPPNNIPLPPARSGQPWPGHFGPNLGPNLFCSKSTLGSPRAWWFLLHNLESEPDQTSASDVPAPSPPTIVFKAPLRLDNPRMVHFCKLQIVIYCVK